MNTQTETITLEVSTHRRKTQKILSDIASEVLAGNTVEAGRGIGFIIERAPSDVMKEICPNGEEDMLERMLECYGDILTDNTGRRFKFIVGVYHFGTPAVFQRL